MAKWKDKAGSGDFSTLFDLPADVKKLEIKSAGTYMLDIVPYVSKDGNEFVEKGDYWWEKTFYIHRGVGVNDEWVICPARTIKEPCPICEFRAKLTDDAEADEKTIDALKPSKRIIVNVVNMKKDRDTVKFLHIAHWYFAREIRVALEASYEDHEDNMEEFYFPENHSYLKCVVENADAGFSGFKIARVDFKSRKEDLDDDILDQAVCLDDVLVIKEYDELKEMLMGGEDEDGDEPESKKKRKKKKKESDDDGNNGDDDYEDMSLKALKKLCKDRDIDVPKKADKDDLVELLEEDDSDLGNGDDGDGDDGDDWADEGDDGDDGDDGDGDGGLEDMDEEELLEYIKENGLKIKGKKKMDEDELREAIEEAEQDDDDDKLKSKKKKKKKKKRK